MIFSIHMVAMFIFTCIQLSLMGLKKLESQSVIKRFLGLVMDILGSQACISTNFTNEMGFFLILNMQSNIMNLKFSNVQSFSSKIISYDFWLDSGGFSFQLACVNNFISIITTESRKSAKMEFLQNTNHHTVDKDITPKLLCQREADDVQRTMLQ